MCGSEAEGRMKDWQRVLGRFARSKSDRNRWRRRDEGLWSAGHCAYGRGKRRMAVLGPHVRNVDQFMLGSVFVAKGRLICLQTLHQFKDWYMKQRYRCYDLLNLNALKVFLRAASHGALVCTDMPLQRYSWDLPIRITKKGNTETLVLRIVVSLESETCEITVVRFYHFKCLIFLMRLIRFIWL